MYKVAVLMSTYNGKHYLREQIDSILAQEGVEVFLSIRDDGSSDETVEIIREYQRVNSNISLTTGENLGVGSSFMQLIYDISNEFDYYAFSDQDDVWLPGKLKSAVNILLGHSKPSLYCSNQILVDKQMNIIGKRYITAPDISYQQIMNQNRIAGCTMVWNQALLTLLTDESSRPSELLLKNRIHDVWVAMVSSVTGAIIYDNASYIYYRQHENNVVGVKKTNIIKQWIQKLKDPSLRNGRSLLCREIYENYKNEIEDDSIKKQLKVYAYYTHNWKYKKLMLEDKSLFKYTNESRVEYVIKVLLGVI